LRPQLPALDLLAGLLQLLALPRPGGPVAAADLSVQRDALEPAPLRRPVPAGERDGRRFGAQGDRARDAADRLHSGRVHHPGLHRRARCLQHQDHRIRGRQGRPAAVRLQLRAVLVCLTKSDRRKDLTVQSTLLASGLGFPEGPTILDDGRVVLCDGNTGELLVYDNGAVSAYARTGGSPWGNVPGSGDVSAVSGIQRVNPDGTVELLCSQVAGYQLYGPNDLAFGPDGRLYFTESGSEQDFRFDVRSPGRLFAVAGSGTSVSGEMLLELPGVYPNGIAFDRDQRLYWTESMAHRVRRLEDGKPVTFCQLSDDHVPDGMAFAADGRLFVATTVSQGVTVISPDGQVLAEITLGEHATNCAFDGSVLYVTAT